MSRALVHPGDPVLDSAVAGAQKARRRWVVAAQDPPARSDHHAAYAPRRSPVEHIQPDEEAVTTRSPKSTEGPP